MSIIMLIIGETENKYLTNIIKYVIFLAAQNKENAMYGDHAPVANPPCEQVLVLTEDDIRNYTAEEIIEEAYAVDAVTGDDGDDDGETFWIVFENEPRRLWDFTEKSLRSTISDEKSKLANKQVTN